MFVDVKYLLENSPARINQKMLIHYFFISF